jgi:hypothetical protein
VRAAANDPAAIIEHEHELRLMAVTYAICMSNLRRGSRGRMRQPGTARVPAAPVIQMIKDLEARGFNRAWIGHELNYVNGIQISAGGTCTQTMADRVAQLHHSVVTADLRVQNATGRAPIRTLAELLSGDRSSTAAA